jgi:hypothetical protein
MMCRCTYDIAAQQYVGTVGEVLERVRIRSAKSVCACGAPAGLRPARSARTLGRTYTERPSSISKD